MFLLIRQSGPSCTVPTHSSNEMRINFFSGFREEQRRSKGHGKEERRGVLRVGSAADVHTVYVIAAIPTNWRAINQISQSKSIFKRMFMSTQYYTAFTRCLS